jgi:hypothetical protein
MATEKTPGDLLAGPSETIAASIPQSLANAVRAQTGRREFSRFVAQAMHRELVRRNRDRLVNDLIAELGPPSSADAQAIDDLMR